MGRFVKNFEATQNAADSIAIPSGATNEQPANPEAGALRFNNTVNRLEFFNGTTFVQVSGASGGAHTITRDEFTLDGSTLVYPGLSFEPTADQNVMVFIEGVFQNDTTYSISGTTITLSSTLPADQGKKLHVLHGFDTA